MHHAIPLTALRRCRDRIWAVRAARKAAEPPSTSTQMRRAASSLVSRSWVALFALVALVTIAGCGSGQNAGPLDVQTTASYGQGPILIQHLTYTTFDGSRVPALFSIPRAYAPRGCLIWENGFGGTKEGTERFWPGAARLGIAIFAIDIRDMGQRATSASERFRAARNSVLEKALVEGTVKDLERATDYLWAQPLCRHNIGYAGVSLGGMIGSVFAAQDHRVRTVVLMSVPPTYSSLLEVAVHNHSCSTCVGADAPTLAFLRDIARHTADLHVQSPLDPERWVGKISSRHLLLMFGIHDPIVPPSSARVTAAAAGKPTTVIHYNGGHIPFFGPAAASNSAEIGIFLLKYLVVPTYTGLPHIITPGTP